MNKKNLARAVSFLVITAFMGSVGCHKDHDVIPEGVTKGGSPIVSSGNGLTGLNAKSGSFSSYGTTSDVTMNRNDNGRSGQSIDSLLNTQYLNTNTAAGFGKVASLPVDGVVYGQPLVKSNVNGENLVFVVTEHDSVFAFDADTYQQVWQTSLLLGGTSLSPNDVHAPNITPEIGITATPVIVGNNMYVTAMTLQGGVASWRLHELDIGTGAILRSVVISGEVSGQGAHLSSDPANTITFSAINQLSRAGLVYDQNSNMIYIAFSSWNDNEPDHGWVMAYNADNLQQTGEFMTTPNSGDGNIWQGGIAPAIDSASHLFFATGNGDPNYVDGTLTNTTGGQVNSCTNPSKTGDIFTVIDFSDSVLKLSYDGQKFLLPVSNENFFTPSNSRFLADHDVDLGSGGVMMLPTMNNKDMMVAGGKFGTVFLINRQNLGGVSADTSGAVVASVGMTPGGANSGPGIYGGPAYHNGSIYYAAAGDTLKKISVSASGLSVAATAGPTIKLRGSSPSISASSETATDAIIWVLDASAYTYQWNPTGAATTLTNGPSILSAYDAQTLQPIYTSSAIATDAAGDATKFAVPTVTHGKVFVGTQTEVSVYGMIPHKPVVTSGVRAQSSFHPLVPVKNADMSRPGSAAYPAVAPSGLDNKRFDQER
jgi:outer membrane protein assembly factor BamB